jgi:hypothetical protein
MIPELAESGLLPPGIHTAKWEQFAERFVVFNRTDRRLRIGERIRALYDEIRSSRIVRRFLVAGSFVTSAAEPNDFDCLLVLDAAIVGMTLAPFQYNLISRRRTRRTYQGDVVAVLEGSAAFNEYYDFFQTTRDGRSVGMVEIIL